MAQDMETKIPLGPSPQQAKTGLAGGPDSGGTLMSSDGRGTRVRRRTRKSVQASSGFSLLELLIVVSILLVLAAIATPNLMRALANVRLRSGANAVAGLLQEGRMRAVRDNKYYRVFGYSVDGTVGTGDTRMACLDTDNNATCVTASDTIAAAQGNRSNPQVELGGTNVLTTSAPPASVKSAAGFASNNTVIEQDKSLQVYFNSRGLPCVVSGSVCKNTDSSGVQYAYIYYITDGRPIYGWAAITVSASGRVRVWTYQGNGVWQ